MNLREAIKYRYAMQKARVQNFERIYAWLVMATWAWREHDPKLHVRGDGCYKTARALAAEWNVTEDEFEQIVLRAAKDA